MAPTQVPAPELSGTLSTCTGTLRNLTDYLHSNPLKPHHVSAPEPSKTSPGIYPGTLRNLNTVSAPEPSGTSPAICTETLRNLNRYLHRNPPEPEPSKTSPGICTGTLRNLRNPPEPCWGKKCFTSCDPHHDIHPGGLFIEPAFSTFAVFVIDFIPQITVVLHLSQSSISLKSTRVLFTGYVKKPQRNSLFSALSVLHNFCSELGEVFVGTVFPSPLPSANMRPNLAIEQD